MGVISGQTIQLAVPIEMLRGINAQNMEFAYPVIQQAAEAVLGFSLSEESIRFIAQYAVMGEVPPTGRLACGWSRSRPSQWFRWGTQRPGSRSGGTAIFSR